MVEAKDRNRRYLADIRVYGVESYDLFIMGNVSDRLAFKLRERGFYLPDERRDHFYVWLSPDFKEVRLSTLGAAEWIFSVEVPLRKEDVPADYDEQVKLIIKLIVMAFEEVNRKFDIDLNLIKETAAEVLAKGSDLDIIQCSDTSDRYAAEVILQIRDDNPPRKRDDWFDQTSNYHVFLRVLNKRTGAVDRRFLMAVEYLREVFELFHKVKISKDTARIISKASQSAKRTLEKYASVFQARLELHNGDK